MRVAFWTLMGWAWLIAALTMFFERMEVVGLLCLVLANQMFMDARLSGLERRWPK